jgi:SpoVK/Ycf46/Vps4 family AAA+-type ATPase
MARELSPTIVLFEDIDYIGKKRANEGGSYDKITGELLNQMDGVESNEGIITLASSNYPKALDKALRNRPGRFDIRVRFELPDSDLRRKMFDKFLSKTNIADIKIDSLVKKTAGYTGAYIKELVSSSIMLAIEDKSVLEDGTAVLKDKHFDEALVQIEKSRKLDNVIEEE